MVYTSLKGHTCSSVINECEKKKMLPLKINLPRIKFDSERGDAKKKSLKPKNIDSRAILIADSIRFWWWIPSHFHRHSPPRCFLNYEVFPGFSLCTGPCWKNTARKNFEDKVAWKSIGPEGTQTGVCKICRHDGGRGGGLFANVAKRTLWLCVR